MTILYSPARSKNKCDVGIIYQNCNKHIIIRFVYTEYINLILTKTKSVPQHSKISFYNNNNIRIL